MYKEIFTPISDDVIKTLNCGDLVYITGEIYTARDAAHKRLVELQHENKPMPFDFSGNIVFYAGPAPAKPGQVIGSIGPTTAGRMDYYAPELISNGLKIMIGKGYRSEAVKEAVVKYGGVYFAGIGGIAALMSECVTDSEVIAFHDLGTEAVRRLKVTRFPVIVALDLKGRDVYGLRETEGAFKC